MILAIDTSSKTATVAIVENSEIVSEFSIVSERTHSKTIVPMIESVFSCSQRAFEDIEYIACVNGPGSFTGIRIGVSAAKSLAFALKKKIVPVSSLDLLAYNVFAGGYIACPVIDARNKHVYTAFYDTTGNEPERLSEYLTLPISEVIDLGKSYKKPICYIGSGTKSCQDELQKAEGAIVVPIAQSMHRAGALGVYVQKNIEKLEQIEGKDFAPIYMSRSQQVDENA